MSLALGASHRCFAKIPATRPANLRHGPFWGAASGKTFCGKRAFEEICWPVMSFDGLSRQVMESCVSWPAGDCG